MVEGHKRKSHVHRSDLAGEYKWGDLGQFLFFVVFVVGTFCDLFLFGFSSSWQDFVPWYFRLLVFVPLLCVAFYFGLSAHKMVFEDVRSNLVLINSGVFARIRHPLYFASILTFFCFVVLSLSVVAFVVFVFVFLFYFYLCRYEERLLVEKIGDDYKFYMKSVPMLFPKIRS